MLAGTVASHKPSVSSHNRGRNDIADLKSLHVNALRMYEAKGYYSHVSFLNAAYSAGMKVRAGLTLIR